MTSEKDARPSYLLETTQTNALHLRNKNTDEGYEEEKKDVGHHQESGFVENYDTSMVSSPGGPLNPQAVYVSWVKTKLSICLLSCTYLLLDCTCIRLNKPECTLTLTRTHPWLKKIWASTKSTRTGALVGLATRIEWTLALLKLVCHYLRSTCPCQ